jgi:hypothetical protein
MTRVEERVIRVSSLGDLSTLHGGFAEGATRGYILDDVCHEEEAEVGWRRQREDEDGPFWWG